MKRPPPDPAARVFTATERTQAADLAREEALRHPAPSALERAVDDVKEGTAIGASMIAGAVSSWAVRIVNRAAAAKHGTAQAIRRTVVGTAGIGRRSMGIVEGATRAVTGRAMSGTMVVASALVVAIRVTSRATIKTVTGTLLAFLALGLGLAAIVVGFVGAAKTGLILLSGAAAAGSRYLWNGLRVASRSAAVTGHRAGVAGSKVLVRGVIQLSRGVATGSRYLWNGLRVASRTATVTGHRAGVAGSKALARGGAASSHATARATEVSRVFLSQTASDFSRLRLTIRWHAHTARPIVSALTGAFSSQLVQSIRRIQRRHVALVGFAVLIAAVYGAARKDPSTARSASPISPASAPSPPALASVAPTADAHAAPLVRSMKDRSAALLAPTKPQGPASTRSGGVTAADADEGQSTGRRGSMLGTLLIASAPKGAKVTIDGIPRGHSPLSVSRLRAGNRIVRLELDGYRRWSWAVYVSASRPTRLNVSLVPDSAASPSSAVTNTAAAAK